MALMAIEKPNSELPIGRLRAYLRRLPPHAQSKLLHEIESKVFVEREILSAKFIEQELRVLLHSSDYQQDRLGNPSRLFFKPLEPFLVTGAPDHDKGQISRASLKPIWAWISHDLLPGATNIYCVAVKSAARVSDLDLCEKIAREFQEKVVDVAGQMLSTSDRTAKTLEHLVLYMAPTGILEVLFRILPILKGLGTTNLYSTISPPKSVGPLARKLEHRDQVSASYWGAPQMVDGFRR